MACRLDGAEPLSEPMLEYCLLDPSNKLQWNLDKKLYLFIQENAYMNVVWKKAAILSRAQYVKSMWYLISHFLQTRREKIHNLTTSANPSRFNDMRPFIVG